MNKLLKQLSVTYNNACTIGSKVHFQHSTTEKASIPKPFSELPQPKQVPLLGALLDFTKFRNFELSKWYEFLKKRHEDLGPIYKEPKVIALKNEYVATCSPDDIEILFRNENKWPVRPPMEHVVLARQKYGLGVGLSNEQGKDWYETRKLVNEHLLTNDAVWNCAKEHLNVSEDLSDYVGRNLDENNEIEMDNLLRTWALENTIVFALNSRIHAFTKGGSDVTKAIVNINDKFFDLLVKVGFSPPLWKIYDTKDLKDFVDVQKLQVDTLNDMIQSRSNMGCSVLEKATAKSEISPERKVMVLPELLTAGVESTSNAAAFALYCIATNPDKQEILREEINKKMNSGEEFIGKSLQRMRYMHAVLAEMQRVFPLSAGTVRVIDRDLVLSGYHIPAGTTVHLTANLVNNVEEEYFEDPYSFLPERWITKNKYRHRRFALSGSFGIGPRMCPGRRFALQEIGCLLIALLSKYKVEYHHEPFQNSFLLISKPSEEPRFTFKPL